MSCLLQTSAWANQRTASRLCKAALLKQHHQLTEALSLTKQASPPNTTASEAPKTAEKQVTVESALAEETVTPTDAAEWTSETALQKDQTADIVGAPMAAPPDGSIQAKELSRSYWQLKQDSQAYANQWQVLKSDSLFADWMQKPKELECFCLKVH